MGFIKHFETDGAAPNSEGINLYFEFPSDIGKCKELYSSPDGYVLKVKGITIECIANLGEAINKLRSM